MSDILDDWLGPFIGLLTIGLVGIVIWAIIEDSNKWDEFKTSQNCKVIGHMRGDVFNTVGVGGNGKIAIGIGSTPDKTGWSCDDGQQYWR